MSRESHKAIERAKKLASMSMEDQRAHLEHEKCASVLELGRRLNCKAGRLFAPVSLLGRINDKMKPHQERVVTEKTELDTKREKLTAFIGGDMYRTLDKTEQSRLNRQLEAMTLYSNILGERIAAFAP